MPHDVTLIATLAVGFVLAFVFGFAANKLRLPPLVGYLLAGVLMGPHTPGLTADAAMAGQLAEIGVILLMFGVGLHFSVADLMAVRRIAIPGAVGQIVVATAIGAAMVLLWGWSLGAALVLGLSLSVASTVVLLKALEERNAVQTPNGRVAVGWLIVEDLAMVLVLVLLPALAGVLGGNAEAAPHASEQAVFATLGLTLLKVMAFGVIALVVGPRVMPWLLRQAARTGSRELFTLAVLALSVGIAYGAAKLFGVSFALGAFFAGVVLERVRLEPQGCVQFAAAAGRIRRAVLRFGRHAVRSDDHRSRADDAYRRSAAGPDRQVAGRAGHRARARVSDEHRTGGLGLAGAGGRVLVHPGRSRHRLCAAAARRLEPRFSRLRSCRSR